MKMYSNLTSIDKLSVQGENVITSISPGVAWHGLETVCGWVPLRQVWNWFIGGSGFPF